MENTLENTTDIAQVILDTINTLLGNLFSSIDNNLYSILDKISFVSSDILHDSYFESIFGTSAFQFFVIWLFIILRISLFVSSFNLCTSS